MADNNELPGTPISEFTEIIEPENGLFVIIQKNISNFKYDLGKFVKRVNDFFNSFGSKLIIGAGSDNSVKLGTNPSSSSNDNQVATTKWVNDKGYASQSSVNGLNLAVQTINSKIPSEASSSNKLADINYVNNHHDDAKQNNLFLSIVDGKINITYEGE